MRPRVGRRQLFGAGREQHRAGPRAVAQTVVQIGRDAPALPVGRLDGVPEQALAVLA
ncbi:MAG: hypothetical protein U0V56_11675 [Actinomycetota bacterium]